MGGGETAAVVLADDPQARRSAIHGVQLLIGREIFHFAYMYTPGKNRSKSIVFVTRSQTALIEIYASKLIAHIEL